MAALTPKSALPVYPSIDATAVVSHSLFSPHTVDPVSCACFPAAHVVHDVALLVFENFPMSHAVHAVVSAEVVYVPSRQFEQEAALAPEYFPATQV